MLLGIFKLVFTALEPELEPTYTRTHRQIHTHAHTYTDTPPPVIGGRVPAEGDLLSINGHAARLPGLDPRHRPGPRLLLPRCWLKPPLRPVAMQWKTRAGISSAWDRLAVLL